MTVRANFDIRKFSSLVHFAELRTAIESGPYFFLIDKSLSATVFTAASQPIFLNLPVSVFAIGLASLLLLPTKSNPNLPFTQRFPWFTFFPLGESTLTI